MSIASKQAFKWPALELVDYAELEQLVAQADFGEFGVERVIQHETASPDQDNLASMTRKLGSVEKAEAYWMKSMSDVHARLGYHEGAWYGLGYHLVTYPSGRIYLGRPGDLSGDHCYGMNAHSVGVSMFGCFNARHVGAQQRLATSKVLALVLERCHLDEGDLYFHRDFKRRVNGEWRNATDCPGLLNERANWRAAVRAELDRHKGYTQGVRLIVDGQLVQGAEGAVYLRREGDVFLAPVRPVLEALRAEFRWHGGIELKLHDVWTAAPYAVILSNGEAWAPLRPLVEASGGFISGDHSKNLGKVFVLGGRG
jgi:hypothetical protein